MEEKRHIVPNIHTSKKCAQCDTTFGCGSYEEEQACWCHEYPPVLELGHESHCLCPDCLKKEIVRKIDAFVVSFASGENAVNYAKDLPPAIPIEGIDYYLENGRHVFTAWSHLKRGYCCANDCRHCPYKHPRRNTPKDQ